MKKRRFGRAAGEGHRGKEAYFGGKGNRSVAYGKRRPQQDGTSGQSLANHEVELKLVGLVCKAAPVGRPAQANLVEVHEPFQMPAMVGGMDREIQKLPLRREGIGGCSAGKGGPSFSPEIGDSAIIARRVLHNPPVKLDEGGYSVVALELVVAPMAQGELAEEGVAKSIGIAGGENDFDGAMEPRGGNEQVDVGADAGGGVPVEGLGQGNAFERDDGNAGIAQQVQEAGEFLGEKLVAERVRQISGFELVWTTSGTAGNPSWRRLRYTSG